MNDKKPNPLDADKKSPFDLLLDQIREVVHEEIAAALAKKKEPIENKEWLTAPEAAKLYGLPATWFEEKGREGEIERTKPGRYVLFKRRSIEALLEQNSNKKTSH